jgi:hypothetical protein
VAVAAVVVLAAVLFDDEDGVLHLGAEEFGGNRSARDERQANSQVGTFATHHQHLVEGHDIAFGGIELFDLDRIVGGNFVLLAAGLDDCEHISAGAFPRIPCCRALWRRRKCRNSADFG